MGSTGSASSTTRPESTQVDNEDKLGDQKQKHKISSSSDCSVDDKRSIKKSKQEGVSGSNDMSESANSNICAGASDSNITSTVPPCLNHAPTLAPPVYKDPHGNIGFERRDLVRVVSKFLDDMGYRKAAQELENESGIKCESSHVSDILNAIVQGEWDRAIELVNKVKLNTDTIMVELLILERKFAEYLECDNIKAALECLQLELEPRAPHDNHEERLRYLSTCLICPDQVELQKQLRRVGPHSSSRLELAKSVKASIASSELIPTGMLENFIVDSLKSHQVSRGSSNKLPPDKVPKSVSSPQPGKTLNPAKNIPCRLPVRRNNDGVRVYSLFRDGMNDGEDEAQANLHPDPPTTCLWTMEGHNKEEIWDISISKDGQFMASGGKDGTIKVWIFPANPGEPPKHVRTFRPRDEDCSRAAELEEDADDRHRPDDVLHRPFNLVWSLDAKFLLSCSQECNKVFLWSVSDVDANESSANDLPPVNLIPPQVIYSHHTGREATCCTWLPNVNEQRTFLSGGSDGELFVCNFNGTILAALSKSFEDEKNTDGEVGKAREETDDRSASLLPPYENRWPGNEVRCVAVLNPYIHKVHGLRIIVCFSDNYLFLLEIKLNEKFNTSRLKTLQEYPENAIPSVCQFNFHMLKKILSNDTIISFGHLCHFAHASGDNTTAMGSDYCQVKKDDRDAVANTNDMDVSLNSAIGNSSSSSSSACNMHPCIYLPVLIEEGAIKFLRIRGNIVKFSTCELSGVIQHRFSFQVSMATYWVGYSNDTNSDAFTNATFACGTENCIIYIWSFDKEKYEYSDYDFEGVKTFDASDIKKLKRTRLLGHIGPINCVAWNPTHRGYLLSASDDGSICGWGSESMKLEKIEENM